MPAPVQAATAAEVPYSMSSGWATTHRTRRTPSVGSAGRAAASGCSVLSVLMSGTLGGRELEVEVLHQAVHRGAARPVRADGGGAGAVADEGDARIRGDGRAGHGDPAERPDE